jgi:transposase
MRATMSHEIRADYNQTWMFPPSLEDLLEKDHPVRFIREFVDALDLRELGFRMRKSDEGRPNYAADLLLKVWLYGYLERIRSSRRLEKACRQHVALMWLTGMNNPDHNSLWRFWNDNKQALKEVFRQTVRVAMDAGLVDMVLNAVDGTKIAARASTDKAWFQKKLKKRLERLDLWLDQAMKEVDKAEQDESGEYRLPEELAEKQKLRETIQESLTQLKVKQRESMHPGEPEAQMMKTREGTRLGYNAQAVVDSKAGVIVAGEVTTDQNDTHQLVPMLETVQTELGKVAEETAADGGYFSGEQLDKAQKAGFPVLVNLVQLRKAEETGGPYHSSKFEYDSENDCYLCPMGQKLKFEGSRKRESKTHEMRAYRCKSASQCPVRWDCSKDKKGRCVERSPYSGAIRVQQEKQQDKAKTDLLRRRMVIAEPAFARVKHLLEFRRWTMGGLEKVRTQWLFVCALTNLGRMYPLWRERKMQLV